MESVIVLYCFLRFLTDFAAISHPTIHKCVSASQITLFNYIIICHPIHQRKGTTPNKMATTDTLIYGLPVRRWSPARQSLLSFPSGRVPTCQLWIVMITVQHKKNRNPNNGRQTHCNTVCLLLSPHMNALNYVCILTVKDIYQTSDWCWVFFNKYVANIWGREVQGTFVFVVKNGRQLPPPKLPKWTRPSL